MDNNRINAWVNRLKDALLAVIDDMIQESVSDGKRTPEEAKRYRFGVFADINPNRQRVFNGFQMTVKSKINRDEVMSQLTDDDLKNLQRHLKALDLSIDWERYESDQRYVFLTYTNRHPAVDKEYPILNANRRYPHETWQGWNPKKPKNK